VRISAIHTEGFRIAAIFVAIFAFGVTATMNLGVDLMPSVNIPVVNVSISYPGATPSVIDQQITGTRSNENFDPWRSLSASQFGKVLRSRTDVEAVIHKTFRRRQSQLLGQPIARGRRWVRVQHFQERGHAPFGTSTRRSVEIFLVCQSRFAEMNLIINHTRQQVQAIGANQLVDRRRGGRIQIEDA